MLEPLIISIAGIFTVMQAQNTRANIDTAEATRELLNRSSTSPNFDKSKLHTKSEPTLGKPKINFD
ncbi:hypothetical protein [Paramylibacter ulvae]|uniref:hypothetical protein n=1 Tax=Paramylibacter ulvae TaxID=1651968 RepID=UPI001E3B9296|nr:hypothetical protein [Amylibacter ulvae]